MRMQWYPRVDADSLVAALGGRDRNYQPAQLRDGRGQRDHYRRELGSERAGPVQPGGLWERACAVVRDYAFTPPELLTAFYRADRPLRGRELLLVARFGLLRLLLGVRITRVLEETDQHRQAWGWRYETLRGHLERGWVDYRVVKDLDSGRVLFDVDSMWQLDPHAPLLMRLGWAMFGRRRQLRFYRRAGDQLATHAAQCDPDRGERGPLVAVPADPRATARPWFAVALVDPGGEL
jgi:hypothetical protein